MSAEASAFEIVLEGEPADIFIGNSSPIDIAAATATAQPFDVSSEGDDYDPAEGQ